MSVTIYVEGGGTGKQARTKVREAFGKLFVKCGFTGRRPGIVPSGARNDAYDAFKTESNSAADTTVCLLVDSEDPIVDIEKTWEHLKQRDGWDRPNGSTDEDVLLMATCMETWIVADRDTLASFFGKGFNASCLPADSGQETRGRKVLLDSLKKATKDCSKSYAKGDVSFELLGCVDPEITSPKLPSFERVVRILDEKL